MKLLIGGSSSKLFHLQEFGESLVRCGAEYKLVYDMDVYTGFPGNKIGRWFESTKKFDNLIEEFKPDAIFVDRQRHFCLAAARTHLPVFMLLRGDYWSEMQMAKKTLYTSLPRRIALSQWEKIGKKCFENTDVILPICKYLEGVAKEHYPQKPTSVFLEGINASRWYPVKGMELKHPCVGLLQDSNWWGKTKEMLVLSKVLEAMPNVTFYWAGDGPLRERVMSVLGKYENFKWLGRLQYPDKVREYLAAIDVYALVSGMDLAPLTLKEAQLMEKPVVATDVGGIPEMMEDNKTGFLVKEGDYKGWIEKLSLLINDNKKRREMGSEGRKFVESNFNWDLITRRFLDEVTPYIKKK